MVRASCICSRAVDVDWWIVVTADWGVWMAVNPSGRGIRIADAPLSGACHVLWGPTGIPWERAERCDV